ncbi:MAG: monooxygenase [Actinobacteria bacterium]|nr:monooxygenase [Actinomycetota bacterium]
MPPETTCRFDLFTVSTGAVPQAVWRIATDRWRLRLAAPVFWKLLGTGDGRTFDARDADLRRWALLTVWPAATDAAAFAQQADVVPGWRRIADEHWWATLRPLRATGRWSGATPFPARADAGEATSVGPVAVVTRARLRVRRAGRFWRSVAAVNADLDRADGLLLRIGIGEAPIGLQGTFSLWSSAADMQAFAYRGAPHRDVVRRSSDEHWYAEELFARFAVRDHGGTVFGDDPLA